VAAAGEIAIPWNHADLDLDLDLRSQRNHRNWKVLSVGFPGSHVLRCHSVGLNGSGFGHGGRAYSVRVGG
jgi:hypothetical protein